MRRRDGGYCIFSTILAERFRAAIRCARKRRVGVGRSMHGIPTLAPYRAGATRPSDIRTGDATPLSGFPAFHIAFSWFPARTTAF
ncbi:hypothetical protein Bmul_5985 [Burkholderia multivorans ATCC 17616]|nr:hypothetical protein Bmul_5985 [Burkholderia multivorans ATCC 17616]